MNVQDVSVTERQSGIWIGHGEAAPRAGDRDIAGDLVHFRERGKKVPYELQPVKNEHRSPTFAKYLGAADRVLTVMKDRCSVVNLWRHPVFPPSAASSDGNGVGRATRDNRRPKDFSCLEMTTSASK